MASSRALSFAAAEALRRSSSSSINGLNFVLAFATAACDEQTAAAFGNNLAGFSSFTHACLHLLICLAGM